MNQMVIGFLLLSGGLIASTIGGVLVKDSISRITKMIPPNLQIHSDHSGNIQMENIGGTANNVMIYATRYTLKLSAYVVNRIEIEGYSKVGGAIFSVSPMKAKQSAVFAAAEHKFLEFGDNPGVKLADDTLASQTYYAFWIEYQDASGIPQDPQSIVVSGVLNSPDLSLPSRENAIAGSTEWDWLFDVPKIIEEHQAKLF